MVFLVRNELPVPEVLPLMTLSGLVAALERLWFLNLPCSFLCFDIPPVICFAIVENNNLVFRLLIDEYSLSFGPHEIILVKVLNDNIHFLLLLYLVRFARKATSLITNLNFKKKLLAVQSILAVKA